MLALLVHTDPTRSIRRSRSRSDSDLYWVDATTLLAILNVMARCCVVSGQPARNIYMELCVLYLYE